MRTFRGPGAGDSPVYACSQVTGISARNDLRVPVDARFEKGTILGNFARLLDPHEARTRITGNAGTGGRKRRDGGFSLIEIMAGMAIIAILALAILPQFAKYFERASVQNLSSEISNAALTVESDYSLTGKAKYVQANVDASVASANKESETTLSDTVDTSGTFYTIKGTNVAVTNYCLKYVSAGSAAGLQITTKAANPTCA